MQHLQTAGYLFLAEDRFSQMRFLLWLHPFQNPACYRKEYEAPVLLDRRLK